MVTVDIQEAFDVAYRLIHQSADLGPDALQVALRCNLHQDIAPDIGDAEWLITERERFRQLRVHALEVLARNVLEAGWYGAAIEATLAAVRADPFRESAYRLLIKAHLAEGSQFEAHRHYQEYCQLLQTELGVTPSEDFLRILEEGRHGEPSEAAPEGCKEDPMAFVCPDG